MRNVAYSALASRNRLDQEVASSAVLEGRTGGGIEEIASTDPCPETLLIVRDVASCAELRRTLGRERAGQSRV